MNMSHGSERAKAAVEAFRTSHAVQSIMKYVDGKLTRIRGCFTFTY